MQNVELTEEDFQVLDEMREEANREHAESLTPEYIAEHHASQIVALASGVDLSLKHNRNIGK